MQLSLQRFEHPPAHVPGDLAFDFDMYVLPGEFGDDVHAYWKAVQDSYPSIYWTPHYGGHWVVTRGDDMKEIQLDYEQFSNCEPFIPKGILLKNFPEQLDPPEHTPIRKLIMPAFLPKALTDIEQKARDVAIEIIERLRPRGECEFVGEFSSVMPVIAFLSMLELPVEDAPMLKELTGMQTPVTNPGAVEAGKKITEYVKGWTARRKANPGNDLISTIVQAEINGRPLDDEEVLNMCQLVIAGGLDTVMIMTSFTARHLARHPEDRQYLREHPEKIPDAVEEFARRFGTSNLAREVRKDLVFKGISMRKGEQVMMPFPLYGLDDRIHADPMKVDFNRPSFRHSAFGMGPHTCPGAVLARREITIFLQEWLARIPDFRIKPGTRPDVVTGLINGISNLQLEWDV